MEGETLDLVAKTLPNVSRGKEKPAESNSEGVRALSRANGGGQIEIEDEDVSYEALYSASEPSICTGSGSSSDVDEEETIFDVQSSLEGRVGERERNGAGDNDCEPAELCTPTQTLRLD